MSRPSSSIGTVVLLVLLVAVFYPVLFLAHKVAPEAALRTSPPWRSQLGPVPDAGLPAARAARHLGPRLAAMEHAGLDLAIWNPLIGGGRGGWLSSPVEGGAPLPVLSVLLARPGWTWTALVGLELIAAFAACFWLLAQHRLDPWPAAVGSLVFALSGPVAGHWLDWQGSAVALGPLVLAPAFLSLTTWRARAAAWGASVLLAILCGPPAWAFVAVAAALSLLRATGGHRLATGVAAAFGGLVLAVAAAAPVLWLTRAAAESGTPPLAGVVAAEPNRLADFVVPPTPRAVDPVTAETVDGGSPAFVGWPAVFLAATALASARRREVAVWLGILAVGAVLVVLPAGTIARAPSLAHPVAVVALALSALAAFGVDRLLRDLREGVRTAVGTFVSLLVLCVLLPVAIRGLPLSRSDEGPLPSPLPPSAFAHGSRIVGLLGALPPDSAAALGAADVRAADLRLEPRYAAALGLAADDNLSLSRALDPALGRLGARWVVEPLPLRVVSGSIYSAIELSETNLPPSSASRPVSLDVVIPPGASRVGLPATVTLDSITVRRATQRIALREDRALSGESDAWRWFTLPDEAGEPTTALVASVNAPAGLPALTLAWDRSGLSLATEGDGVRLWERRNARPLAYFADRIEADRSEVHQDPGSVLVPADLVERLAGYSENPARARIERVGRSPNRVDVAVASDAAALLVVQVKHRPRLWRATVNGRPVVTYRTDLVWTGIPLEAGRSEVTLKARIPLWTLLSSLAGGAAMAVLWWQRRKE